jgi:hypothetical protein
MNEMNFPRPIHPDSGLSDEIIKLKCPACCGGLNLRRSAIGLSGYCVHCRTPLSALGEAGAGDVLIVAGMGGPQPEKVGTETEAAKRPRTDVPLVPMAAAATPPATRLSDNLFPTAADPLKPLDGMTSPFAAPFAADHGSQSRSSPSAFAVPGAEVSVMIGWGTNVPREVHASISPFGLKAHHGSGLAESLFREKIGAPVAASYPTAPTAFGFPSASAEIFGTTATSGRLPAPTTRTATLPGQGNSLSSSGDDAAPDPIFRHENADAAPGRFRWILRLTVAMVIGLCLLSGAAVAMNLMPKEKRLAWKSRAIEWLEPGRPVLEHLPEEFQPEWGSRSELGIGPDDAPTAGLRSPATP